MFTSVQLRIIAPRRDRRDVNFSGLHFFGWGKLHLLPQRYCLDTHSKTENLKHARPERSLRKGGHIHSNVQEKNESNHLTKDLKHARPERSLREGGDIHRGVQEENESNHSRFFLTSRV